MVGRHEAKEWAKAHLKGMFSSPSAPFTANFALDQAGVIKNVERVIAAGASGVGFGFGIGYCSIRTSMCAGGGVTAAIRRVQGGTATRQTKLLDGCQDGIQPN
jgi:hypothetical protein